MTAHPIKLDKHVTPDVLLLSDPAQLHFEIIGPKSGPLYDTILSQRSLLQNVSYIHFFAIYRFLFFFFFVSVSFLVYLHDLKSKKSHARRSRTIIVRPFAFPFPASVSLALFFIHTHYLVYTPNSS